MSSTAATRLFATLLTALACSVPGALPAAGGPDASLDAYLGEMDDWHARRDQRLRDPGGYLSQVALEWLQEGENRLGSLPESTIRIPGGPADWGTIHLSEDEIRYLPTPGAGILVDGREVPEAVLYPDVAENTTLVQQGDLSFYVIFRQSYALRVKHRQSPDLVAFSGVEHYPVSPDWRIQARFERAPEGTTIPIANVLGQTDDSAVFGTIVFERDGTTHRLIGLGDENSESLWFLFADRTSGRETYGAGRFLYSDGMPEDGRLVVDFNKAYNPPCAFNDFSTCPLPPQDNRLGIAVRAGEMKYHH